MSNNAAASVKKDAPNLSLREKIEVIRSNRYFLAIFPFAILLLMILGFGLATGGKFLGFTYKNDAWVFNSRVPLGIFKQAIIIGTCATGVAFIYSNGNLDISIGAVLGLAATLGMKAYAAGGSVPVMMLICMAAAIGLMLFNCTMSVVCNIKTITVAIVVTQIYNAISTVLIGGAGKIDFDYDTAKGLMDGGFNNYMFIVYFVVCILIFHKTRVGRELRFLGGNENCAEQTGMSNAKSTYISFLITGIGIGLAAIFSVLDVSAVSVETGNGLGMDVMLATVLGGMSIFGGARSNAYAGFIGALTVAALNKGLLMVGVSSALIQGIRGVIFLLLVYLNSERQNLLPSRVQF